jgi:hypothetical protein
LKSIILISVVCAVALTWWRQRSLVVELGQYRKELEWSQTELELLRNVNDVCRLIDPDIPKQRQLLRALRFISGGVGFWASFDRRMLVPGYGKGPLEVLIFHHNSHSIPGEIVTIGVLTRGYGVIDFVVHNVSTRVENHEVKLEDQNDDGWPDVVVEGNRGYHLFMDLRTPQPFRSVYVTTDKGFVQLVDPRCDDAPP